MTRVASLGISGPMKAALTDITLPVLAKLKRGAQSRVSCAHSPYVWPDRGNRRLLIYHVETAGSRVGM